jgi:hypothetical protein
LVFSVADTARAKTVFVILAIQDMTSFAETAISRALIVGLLFSCRPADVARFVIAIGVGITIKAVFRAGGPAYVPKECFVAAAPAFVNLNSSSAVTPKAFVVAS